jgi:hypothetical protein
MAVKKGNRIPASATSGAYAEVQIDFASTAAEATSAAVTKVLPEVFKPNKPIYMSLKVGEAAMDDNAIIIGPSFSYSGSTKKVTLSVKFHNGNVAAGAAIAPGSKTFTVWQP